MTEQNNKFSILSHQKPGDRKQNYLKIIGELLSKDAFEKASALDVLELTVTMFPEFGTSIGQGNGSRTRNELMQLNAIGHYEKVNRYFEFNIHKITVRQQEVDKAMTMDEKSLEEFILKLDRGDKSYKFLEEFEAYLVTIDDSERVKQLIRVFINIAPVLKNSIVILLPRRSTDSAYRLLYKLLSQLSSEEQYQVINKVLETYVSLTQVEAVLHVLDVYGSDEYKIRYPGEAMSENQQSLLTEKVTNIAFDKLNHGYSIYNFSDWVMTFAILMRFRKDQTTEYIKTILEEDDRNIIKFFHFIIHSSIAEGIIFKINNQYEEYISDEQIAKAIQTLKNSGKLFSFDDDLLKRVAAYTILKDSDQTRVSECDCIALVNEWKQEYITAKEEKGDSYGQ